jgi:hypothetical protein
MVRSSIENPKAEDGMDAVVQEDMTKDQTVEQAWAIL